MPDPRPIELAEWKPDASDRFNPTREARGVVSIGGQYGPFPSIQDYGPNAKTTDTCLGANIFYDADGTPHIFMGDGAALYELQSRVATDVSITGGYALGASDTWQNAQFGNHVVFVSRNADPQVFEMGVPGETFDDLGGSPPSGATSVARVGDFVMMGVGHTLHWSAFNNVSDWVPDAGTQAGNQELDQEQGDIQTIIGLDYAAIFQDRAIRRAIYVGPPIVWDFGQDYVEKARGCISRNAAAPFGRGIFYCADDGFYVFDGQSSLPIGHGKVDDYFVRNVNYGYRHKICVAIDMRRKLAVFGIPMGSSQVISELLIYSIQDGRWTHDPVDLEHLFASPSEPYTVENISTLFTNDNLDDDVEAMYGMPDDIDSAVYSDIRRHLGGVQTGSHRLGLFTGPNRPARVDTKEFEVMPGKRGLITEVWPMGDMRQGDVSASIVRRASLPGGQEIASNATSMNRAGFCPQRVDGRFCRVRLSVAAGASWRRMEGAHIVAQPTAGR